MKMAECQVSSHDVDAALRRLSELQRSYPAHDDFDRIANQIEQLEEYSSKNRDAGMEKITRLIGEVLIGKSKAKLAYQLGEIYFHDLKDYLAAASNSPSRSILDLIRNMTSGARIFGESS